MITADAPRLYTTGEVAGLLGEPWHRVQYAIRSHNIRPRLQCGKSWRLFDDDGVREIREALGEITRRY